MHARIALVLSFLVALFVQRVFPQSRTDSFITGTTRDCVNSREIRPAGADVYLINPKKYPRISRMVYKTRQQMKQRQRSYSSLEKSDSELLREVRAEKSVPRTQSGDDGTFAFEHLHADQHFIVLGIPTQKGDPVYYSLIELTLTPGENTVVLDFYANQPCNSAVDQESQPVMGY
jgi:hypothetical protein